MQSHLVEVDAMGRSSLFGLLGIVVACSSTSSTGATSDQIQACKRDGCDHMKFFQCASASEQAACDKIQSTCGGQTMGGGGGTDAGGMDQGAILQCQQQCDGLLFQSCIDAAKQSTCRSLCSTVTSSKRDTFNACVLASTDCTKGN